MGTRTAPARSPVDEVVGRDAERSRSTPRSAVRGPVSGATSRIDGTYPNDVLSPNPRTIANELLARRHFIPATTLNLLAAAWIQFEVHDWMSHGTNVAEDPWEVELEADDSWPTRPMKIQRTKVDPTSDGGPPTYRNTETHWWDASQVYGSQPDFEEMVRTFQRGRVKLTSNGALTFDPPNMAPLPGVDLAAMTNNWWLGLAMMHTLFMREHNSICEMLAAVHPELGRPATLRPRPTHQRRLDRQDPHRGVDARHAGRLGHGDGHELQLVGHPGKDALETGGSTHQERGVQRRSRIPVVLPRHAVLHDRGVHVGLSHASAHPGRVQHSRERQRSTHRRLRLHPVVRCQHPRGARGPSNPYERPVLLIRHESPRCDRAAQLPRGAATLRTARRHAPRPRDDRHPAQPRTWRAALQRVPAQVPPPAFLIVRGDERRRPGRGGPAPRLRRRRGGRLDGRPLLRATAGGVRLQRHRVSRLHLDGDPTTQERPLLHLRLPTRGVHEGGHGLDRGQHHEVGPASSLSESARRAQPASTTASSPGARRRARPHDVAMAQRVLELLHGVQVQPRQADGRSSTDAPDTTHRAGALQRTVLEYPHRRHHGRRSHPERRDPTPGPTVLPVATRPGPRLLADAAGTATDRRGPRRGVGERVSRQAPAQFPGARATGRLRPTRPWPPRRGRSVLVLSHEGEDGRLSLGRQFARGIRSASRPALSRRGRRVRVGQEPNVRCERRGSTPSSARAPPTTSTGTGRSAWRCAV